MIKHAECVHHFKCTWDSHHFKCDGIFGDPNLFKLAIKSTKGLILSSLESKFKLIRSSYITVTNSQLGLIWTWDKGPVLPTKGLTNNQKLFKNQDLFVWSYTWQNSSQHAGPSLFWGLWHSNLTTNKPLPFKKSNQHKDHYILGGGGWKGKN